MRGHHESPEFPHKRCVQKKKVEIRETEVRRRQLRVLVHKNRQQTWQCEQRDVDNWYRKPEPCRRSPRDRDGIHQRMRATYQGPHQVPTGECWWSALGVAGSRSRTTAPVPAGGHQIGGPAFPGTRRYGARTFLVDGTRRVLGPTIRSVARRAVCPARHRRCSNWPHGPPGSALERLRRDGGGG